MDFLDEGGAVCPQESREGGDVAAPEDECQMGTAFGQTAGANEALSDPEDVDMSETKSHTSTTATWMAVPIMFRGKALQCFLRRRKANERSPLVTATPSDQWGGGYAPWTNYTKIRSEDGTVIGKTPAGTTCLISRNVYKAIGYATKYGGCGKYKSIVLASKEATTIHAAFVASEKALIQQHNENTDMGRLKNKKQSWRPNAHSKLSRSRPVSSSSLRWNLCW